MLGGMRAGRLIAKALEIGDLDSREAAPVIGKLRKLGAGAVRRVLDEMDTADKHQVRFYTALLARMAADGNLPHFTRALTDESQRKVAAVGRALAAGTGYNPNRLVDLMADSAIPKSLLCEILSAQGDRLDLRRVLTQAYMQESTDKAALFKIVADAATEKDIPELISRLTGKDLVARAHLIDILSRFDRPEVHRALEGQLKDPNKLIRQAAINALARMDAHLDIALLCSLLCDPDLDVQNKAVDVIVRLRHPDTVRNLVVALKDDSEYARRAAVEVLNEVADPESIKDLLEALGDDDWWVRARATDALAKIGGPKVVDAVLRLVNDDNEDIRRAAIEILNSTGDKRAVDKLIEATTDADWWVRERAADALAEIGDEAAIPALEEMLTGEIRSVPSAIRALSRLGSERHVDMMMKLLDRPEREIQVEAVNALARLADPGNAETIRNRVAGFLESQDKAVRQSAVAAVKDLDDRFSPSQIQAAKQADRFAEPSRTLLVEGRDLAAMMGGGAVQERLDITALKAGDVVEGRYEYIKKIGKGAFGTVLLFHDRVVDENLVLKFLNPNVASDAEMLKRFVHELRYSRKITHKNVIRIFDFLQLGGLYAISMEFFASHPLGDEVVDEQPLPVDKAVRYGVDIATGMAVAHQAGIVHRDLKPANVLINDEGLVKIVDFGVAAARSSGDTQLTKTGYVIGSPKYMAPEQILGKQVDEKADIYSLGVIMYEMLTGIPPYRKGDHMSVMYQHVQGKARSASEVNPGLPQGLSDCIGACMAVDKSRRYGSMEQLREALLQYLPAEA